MRVQDVLKNLTDYDSWEFHNYRLCEEESKVIVDALKKQMPMPCKVTTVSDTDENGADITWDVDSCPVCHKIYRFSVPKYCEVCGQMLK